MRRQEILMILAALALGGALWLVFNLHPVWWLAWIVPGLVFAVALSTEGWTSRGLVAIAALIGAASNYRYLLSVMPLPAAMLALLLQTLMWVLILGIARRIVKSFESAWTVLALPVVAVAVDTLLAYFTPDGNWGSLAYTQAGMLPIAQLAAIFGVGGVLFLLMLGNSALALALVYRRRLPGALPMYGVTLAAIALTWAFGAWRVAHAAPGESLTFGIASVDDYIEGQGSPNSREVWAQYEAQVAQLAGSGAKLVLLPEKIAVLKTRDAEARKAWLARLARDNQVWLVAGVGVDDGRQRRNEAWWFAPDGRLVTNYLKHFMAPPEREFVAGHEFPVNDIAGVRYGVAICKDMHFSRLGRSFGRRHARVMLVPAWDFDRDAEMAANMTRMRGVESGFAIVRAARDGLLTISDAYGRVLAVDRSTRLPGTTLLATVDIGAPVATIYTRIGDALGWICVLAAIVLMLVGIRRRRRDGAPA
ncbi:MAG TPA: nitrilase-related carbon-nitrogen hydrolase [Steroidobacteraceae bacterium]|nr:nitrilase-related carbon-nitrogen hydrolase [Steroidobacteraceae bacterium]